MTTRGERPEDGVGISEEGERWITLAIAVGLVALIPSLVLAFFLYREIEDRTNDNRALIEEDRRHDAEQEAIRVQVRAAIRRADIANCEQDELVKKRLRKISAFDPEAVAFTLEQLGIDPGSERGQQLVQRAKANAAEAQAALAPRDCQMLPDPNEPYGQTP